MDMVRAGPIGDITESKTDIHWDEKGHTKISHIFVSFNSSYIISIQFGYFENGALVMSAKYGGPSKGQNFRVVKLKHNEYVTGFSGVVVTAWGGRLLSINSLIFYTNLGKHGPICDLVPKFSNATSTKKEIDMTICDRLDFGGFFGSCDEAKLKSIGIYVTPTPSSDAVVKRENV
ncbi:Jacalin-related lectin 24 [Cardamine amara subsp. amara]|uniref:Jacalin-related lectin 24 n=1 Tax=Cardamine amara subsp. amara TaxID=228776 RepID=A0ABD0ZUW7_CARAN